MISEKWIEEAKNILDKIKKKEMQNIKKAANIIADSILSGHVCYLFGVGHSTIPVEETYPRYGGIIGFLPILELPLSYFTHVIGDLGIFQFQFLEMLEGYGERILKNYILDPKDSMIIYSNSGVTPIIIDVALTAKEKGVKLIAVTSIEHSKNLKSEHSSGKKLYEIADVTIDNCTPQGDVIIELESFKKHRVGPLSTLGSIAVANLISIEVAQEIVKRGGELLVNPVRGYTPEEKEMLERNIKEYGRRLAMHLIHI